MAAHSHIHADYYSILQVNRNASQDEIRLAYKQRAMALHPDKNTDSAATKDFQRLVEAYSILKDPQKRAQYDARGRHHHLDDDDEDDDDEEDYYYDDDDDEYDDDDDDEPRCSCPFHHHSASFAAAFEELFARHYNQYGYRGFFDDEDEADDRPQRNFWRKFGTKGNSRFGMFVYS